LTVALPLFFSQLDCRFKTSSVPSTFGDELRAESTVTEFRRSSFVLRHQYFKDQVLAVEGIETRVWAGLDPQDPKRMKSRPLPPEVIARLSENRA
jgi:4-hydroxybenzoyl-CoA thioesterase